MAVNPPRVRRDTSGAPAPSLFSIPAVQSFEDVRQILSKGYNSIQQWVLSLLPVTNYQGKRISNVGVPVEADDVVTLRYIQGGQPTNVTYTASAAAKQSIFASFTFDTVTINGVTNFIKNQTPSTLRPIQADISAVVASVFGNTLIDVQTSADCVSWSTILNSDISLPINSFKTTSVTTFTGSWIAGNYLRAIIAPLSATDATEVLVQVEFQ